nr:hypothetical protein [uncultured Oscillibacter sp.]
MDKGRIIGAIMLLAVTAGAIGYTASRQAAAEAARQAAAYEALLDTAPVAQVEGETVSPNGRFEVRTVGESDLWISGVRIPEALQIVDTETGEVVWEDTGYVSQSALWSPGNNLVAIACGARTWGTVRVVNTAYWTTWEFTLPDGSPIPEYTFLPEDWGRWLDMDTLLVTVGQGGDAGAQHTYRCSLRPDEDGTLTGSVLEQTTEILPGSYDFDHDGSPETVEVVTVLTPETPYFPAWYDLVVRTADGAVLWTEEDLALAHAGWGSVFACTVDGADCLLTYDPAVYQGSAAYAYELLSLENGVLTLLRQGSVEFDIDAGILDFDPEAIAAFLEEVHGYLDASTLLLSTEGGEYASGGSGADFRGDDFSGTLYDTPGTWLERVQAARAALGQG